MVSSSVKPKAHSSTMLMQLWSVGLTSIVLLICFFIWFGASCLDAIYTPRDFSFVPTRRMIVSYQWCMVGYGSNLLLTLIKVIFEKNRNKLNLHLVSSYINLVSACSYYMLWTGFSTIMEDRHSCLYIPQRWLLYIFTVPHIMYLLSQMSDYTTGMWLWVVVENVVMLAAGGLGTVPWFSRSLKALLYMTSIIPFPFINIHMYRMVSGSITDDLELASKRSLGFIRIFSIVTWNTFPIMYFAAIDGALPLDVSEPLWSVLDWLTKMVYSSSLMEASFFTISQRRELQKAAEEQDRIKQIEQLNIDITRKDDFLSTMSHELRTPLNGIIGLSEALMIGTGGELPEKAHQTIATIKMSGKRLLQLINDILDAAKMKQGGIVIKHEEVDIHRVMHDVTEITKSLVSRKVVLVNNVGKDVPIITADADRLVQIMYNLIGNAAKFTRSGSITVAGGKSKDGRRIFLSVTDTGLGIPSTKFEQIFGAFEQVDMSTTRRYGGTGLGLHLVKQLVEAHHGEITVQSEVGVGSTFTVWLPIDQKTDSFAQEEEAVGSRSVEEEWDALSEAMKSSRRPSADVSRTFHHEKNQGQFLVLSVDDDPINQMVVESLLSPEGFKVEQAMDGDDALEYLSSSPYLPDLILLDVMMPGMNGYEVCQLVRKRFKKEAIPIIMLSAKNTSEDVAKGLELGANDYVKKPFDRKELISRISNVQLRNRDAMRSGEY